MNILSSFAIIDDYINEVGKIVARAAAIETDCQILNREPTTEEKEILDWVAEIEDDYSFLVGTEEKVLGTLY